MVLTTVGIPVVSAASFDDTAGHWAETYIDTWTGYDVIHGDGNGLFRPDDAITRAEVAQVTQNVIGYVTAAGNSFTDVDPNAWYADAVLKLVAAGTLKGNGDGTMTPEAFMTREEAMTMLARAYGLTPDNTQAGITQYADYTLISDYATGYIGAMTASGYVNGYEDGTIRPQDCVSRAEFVKMLDNMIKLYITAPGTYGPLYVDGLVLVKSGGVTLNGVTAKGLIISPQVSGNVGYDSSCQFPFVNNLGSATVNGSTDTGNNDFLWGGYPQYNGNSWGGGGGSGGGGGTSTSTYTVRFYVDGKVIKTANVRRGAKLTATQLPNESDYLKADKTFTGWYTNANAAANNNPEYFFDVYSDTVIKTLNLYAGYSENGPAASGAPTAAPEGTTKPSEATATPGTETPTATPGGGETVTYKAHLYQTNGTGGQLKEVAAAVPTQAPAATQAPNDNPPAGEGVSVTTEWTFGDDTTSAIAPGTLDLGNGLTYIVTDDKSAYATGKEVGGVTFPNRIKLGGKSTFDESNPDKVFTFTPAVAGTVTVYFAHASSSGDPRSAQVYQSGNLLGSKAADAGTQAVTDAIAVATGAPVYIGGDANIAVYGITFTVGAAAGAGIVESAADADIGPFYVPEGDPENALQFLQKEGDENSDVIKYKVVYDDGIEAGENATEQAIHYDLVIDGGNFAHFYNSTGDTKFTGARPSNGGMNSDKVEGAIYTRGGSAGATEADMEGAFGVVMPYDGYASVMAGKGGATTAATLIYGRVGFSGQPQELGDLNNMRDADGNIMGTAYSFNQYALAEKIPKGTRVFFWGEGGSANRILLSQVIVSKNPFDISAPPPSNDIKWNPIIPAGQEADPEPVTIEGKLTIDLLPAGVDKNGTAGTWGSDNGMVSATVNATSEYGDFSEGFAPTSGSAVKISVTENGKIGLITTINANKTAYVLKFKSGETANGEAVVNHTPTDKETGTTVEFDVEPGYDYYFLIDGSKASIGTITYTPSGASEPGKATTAPAATETPTPAATDTPAPAATDTPAPAETAAPATDTPKDDCDFATDANHPAFAEGTTVQFIAPADAKVEDIKVTKGAVAGQGEAVTVDKTNYTFTMPASEASVEVTYVTESGGETPVPTGGEGTPEPTATAGTNETPAPTDAVTPTATATTATATPTPSATATASTATATPTATPVHTNPPVPTKDPNDKLPTYLVTLKGGAGKIEVEHMESAAPAPSEGTENSPAPAMGNEWAADTAVGEYDVNSVLTQSDDIVVSLGETNPTGAKVNASNGKDSSVADEEFTVNGKTFKKEGNGASSLFGINLAGVFSENGWSHVSDGKRDGYTIVKLEVKNSGKFTAAVSMGKAGAPDKPRTVGIYPADSNKAIATVANSDTANPKVAPLTAELQSGNYVVAISGSGDSRFIAYEFTTATATSAAAEPPITEPSSAPAETTAPEPTESEAPVEPGENYAYAWVHKGDIVHVTLASVENLDSITVAAVDGTAIDFTNENGVITFTMPAKDVNVTAEYIQPTPAPTPAEPGTSTEPGPGKETPAPGEDTPEPGEGTPIPATEAPEQPTTAPEQPTTAPEQPTQAPEQPTTAPEQPTTAPEQPTTAPELPPVEGPIIASNIKDEVIKNGTVLMNDDNVTIQTTVSDAKHGGAAFDQPDLTDLKSDNSIQVRVGADPSAENPYGTAVDANGSSAPWIVRPKKDGTLTLYYRRQSDDGSATGAFTPGTGKDVKVSLAGTNEPILNGEFTMGTVDDKGFGFAKQTFKLEAGKEYVIWARGTTLNICIAEYAADEQTEPEGPSESPTTAPTPTATATEAPTPSATTEATEAPSIEPTATATANPEKLYTVSLYGIAGDKIEVISTAGPKGADMIYPIAVESAGPAPSAEASAEPAASIEPSTEPAASSAPSEAPATSTEPTASSAPSEAPATSSEPAASSAPEEPPAPSAEASSEPEESAAPGPEESAAPGPEESVAPGPEESVAPEPEESAAPGPEESTVPEVTPAPSATATTAPETPTTAPTESQAPETTTAPTASESPAASPIIPEATGGTGSEAVDEVTSNDKYDDTVFGAPLAEVAKEKITGITAESAVKAEFDITTPGKYTFNVLGTGEGTPVFSIEKKAAEGTLVALADENDPLVSVVDEVTPAETKVGTAGEADITNYTYEKVLTEGEYVFTYSAPAEKTAPDFITMAIVPVVEDNPIDAIDAHVGDTIQITPAEGLPYTITIEPEGVVTDYNEDNKTFTMPESDVDVRIDHSEAAPSVSPEVPTTEPEVPTDDLKPVAADKETVFDISKLGDGTYTENKLFENDTLKIYATTAKSVTIETGAGSANVDGVKYESRINLGGGASFSDPLSRIVELLVPVDGTLEVIAGSTGNDARTLVIQNGETKYEAGNIIKNGTKVTYEVKAGKVQFGSKTSGLDIYYIKFTPASTEPSPEVVAPEDIIGGHAITNDKDSDKIQTQAQVLEVGLAEPTEAYDARLKSIFGEDFSAIAKHKYGYVNGTVNTISTDIEIPVDGKYEFDALGTGVVDKAKFTLTYKGALPAAEGLEDGFSDATPTRSESLGKDTKGEDGYQDVYNYSYTTNGYIKSGTYTFTYSGVGDGGTDLVALAVVKVEDYVAEPEVSTVPEPEESTGPSTEPEATPSTEPEATPSIEPEATPSAEPSATPTVNPEVSAGPSEEPEVIATQWAAIGTNPEGANVYIAKTDPAAAAAAAAVEGQTDDTVYKFVALKQETDQDVKFTYDIGEQIPDAGLPANWKDAKGTLTVSFEVYIKGGDCSMSGDEFFDIAPKNEAIGGYSNSGDVFGRFQVYRNWQNEGQKRQNFAVNSADTSKEEGKTFGYENKGIADAWHKIIYKYDLNTKQLTGTFEPNGDTTPITGTLNVSSYDTAPLHFNVGFRQGTSLDTDFYVKNITASYEESAAPEESAEPSEEPEKLAVEIDPGSGLIKEASTLTANVTPDGADAGVTYAWTRSADGLQFDPIEANADQKTYAITKDDLGKTLKVTVTGSGDYAEQTAEASYDVPYLIKKGGKIGNVSGEIQIKVNDEGDAKNLTADGINVAKGAKVTLSVTSSIPQYTSSAWDVSYPYTDGSAKTGHINSRGKLDALELVINELKNDSHPPEGEISVDVICIPSAEAATDPSSMPSSEVVFDFTKAQAYAQGSYSQKTFDDTTHQYYIGLDVTGSNAKIDGRDSRFAEIGAQINENTKITVPVPAGASVKFDGYVSKGTGNKAQIKITGQGTEADSGEITGDGSNEKQVTATYTNTGAAETATITVQAGAKNFHVKTITVTPAAAAAAKVLNASDVTPPNEASRVDVSSPSAGPGYTDDLKNVFGPFKDIQKKNN